MLIIEPDPYLMPCYKISPFSTKDVTFTYKLSIENKIDNYFQERFNSNDYYYTKSGRQALNIALSSYTLEKDDIVTIFTTSNNYYISSCVTKEIEKYCKWNREINKKTKVILVNHEFGYPFEGLETLKNYELPIIEDCAFTFFSVDCKRRLGKVVDFVMYSFPKMFPIQIGGLLKVNNNHRFKQKTLIDDNSLRYLKRVLSYYIR